jgi:TolB-like protein
VVGELAVALKARDHERLYRRHTKSLDAYQAFLRAKHLSGFDLESRQRKETAYQRVVELDPEFAGGYAGLSLAYRQYATHVVGPARKEYIKRAFEFAQQAMAKDDTFVWSYLALGGAYYAKREHDKAVITMKRSVDLQPNDADAWTFLGFYLHWAGHGNEAIVALKTAQRLNPKFISRRNVVFLAMAYSTAGKYRKAIETILPHYASFARRGRPAMGYLAAAYAANGDRKKAQATMKEYLAKKPKYRISNYPMLKNYKRAEDRERFAALLRKAGMPERATVAPVNEKSIAVLPFKNMSDDKAHEYFSDGITEDIITDLSKLSKLFVVARKSSFRFKGRTVDPKQVGRELRASYLLEGSVRRAGDRLRISAQLIDATTGGELWSERYDGKLADTFALQDKVTARIIDAMSLELGAKEREKLADHGTDNFAAHDAFLKGQSYARQYTSEGFARAIREFERALKLDPQYKRASAAIAQTRFINENSGLR